jgi:glucokinase
MPDPRDIIIGVDLGGTHFQVGAVTAEGQIIGRARGETPAGGQFEVVCDTLARAVRAVCADAELTLEDILAVGIGAPGAAVPSSGVILQAGNLPWNHVPLGANLSARLSDSRVVHGSAMRDHRSDLLMAYIA